MTFEAKDRYAWHDWFAWAPVKIRGKWVWLEWVERQYCDGEFGDVIFYRQK